MKQPLLVEGHGIPPGRVLTPRTGTPPPLAPTPGKPGEPSPLPDDTTAHPDAGYTRPGKATMIIHLSVRALSRSQARCGEPGDDAGPRCTGTRHSGVTAAGGYAPVWWARLRGRLNVSYYATVVQYATNLPALLTRIPRQAIVFHIAQSVV